VTPTRVRFLLVCAVLGALLLLALRGRLLSAGRGPSEDALLSETPTRLKPAPASPPPRRSTNPGQGTTAAESDPTWESGLAPRELAERRLERARRTLDSYLQATRYPPVSRPLSERPDLQNARSVPTATQPLARADGKLTDAKVTLSQDRYFLVGDEAARLTVSCTTSEGPARCEVIRSEARVPPTMPQAGTIPPAPIAFYNDGRDGDPKAGNGVPTALFAPAREGFGGYHGPIGVDLLLHVDGEEGGARFEVLYTPAAPARFTGDVREALEEGSLCMYVQMAIDKPGRYVLHARADDTNGKRFAFLEYNEELSAGSQEAKMCLFGKLVRDEHARSPFVLRDLEGFLLKEDAYPDRELVPALVGSVHRTGSYEESQFSDAEWESEEKKRHVDEFTKDVAEAEKELREVESAGGQ
jgi:hypothetical protein